MATTKRKKRTTKRTPASTTGKTSANDSSLEQADALLDRLAERVSRSPGWFPNGIGHLEVSVGAEGAKLVVSGQFAQVPAVSDSSLAALTTCSCTLIATRYASVGNCTANGATGSPPELRFVFERGDPEDCVRVVITASPPAIGMVVGGPNGPCAAFPVSPATGSLIVGLFQVPAAGDERSYDWTAYPTAEPPCVIRVTIKRNA